MMLDLDNTLIGRDGAFRIAVTAFLKNHQLLAADAGWPMPVDASGDTHRAEPVAGAAAGTRGPQR